MIGRCGFLSRLAGAAAVAGARHQPSTTRDAGREPVTLDIRLVFRLTVLLLSIVAAQLVGTRGVRQAGDAATRADLSRSE